MSTISASGTLYIRGNPQAYNLNQYSGVSAYSNIQYSNDNLNWTTTIRSSWPMTIINTDAANQNVLNVLFTSTIYINVPEICFITGSNFITYDGSNNIVNINVGGSTPFTGLIGNGANGYNYTYRRVETSVGYSDVIVKNIKTAGSGTGGVAGDSPVLCRDYFGINARNIYVQNCSNSMTGQCLCGRGFGSNCSNAFISNCSNSGTVYYSSIVRDFCGEKGGYVTIENCSNSGNINTDSSGICGNRAAHTGGNVIIKNCKNTGNLGVTSNSYGNAGICGIYAGERNGSVSIINCSNTGNINSINSGGICGNYFGLNTNKICSISDSYSTGNITKKSSGGICGPDLGYNDDILYKPAINITNCYSSGQMLFPESNGIIAGYDTSANKTISENTNYKNRPTINIRNCYVYVNQPTYSSEPAIVPVNATFGSFINQTNCYLAKNVWSDVSANLLLSGTPANIYKPGATWAILTANAPYALKSFNLPIYSPSVFNNFVSSYTSSPGLFSPTDYSYNLISVDNLPTNTSVSSITINQNNGVLQFDNVIKYAERIARVSVTKGTAPNYTDYNFNTFVFSNICFLAKTPIKTDQGLINIDEINPEIHTIRNKKIVDITRTISQDKHLICFEKDCLGNNIPSQKTIMSKNHEVLYKGKMLKAKEFLGLVDNVYTKKYNGEVLYNVLMEEHEKMVVNNLICETLHPNNRIAKLFMMLQKMSPENQEAFIKQFNEITENEDEIKKNMAIAKK